MPFRQMYQNERGPVYVFSKEGIESCVLPVPADCCSSIRQRTF